MKKIILYLLTIFCFTLSGQTTLTQSFNEPKPSDLETVYPLDTSGFNAGLPNISGNNVTWDFKKLKAVQPVIDNYYFSASSIPTSTDYPGCTFVQESGGVYTFFKSTTTPTTQTEFLGLQASTITINLSNSAIIAKYPVSFGSSSTDNLSGTFNFSVTGTCNGNIITTADGQGILQLPEGITFSNVLRVKSVQTISLTAGFIPAGVLKQTIYNYYHSSQKFPILSVNYSRLTSPFLSSPTESGFATGSYHQFVTGINDHAPRSSGITIYPNPAQTLVNVEASAHVREIHLYDQMGRLVIAGTGTNQIDISSLEKGIYVAEVLTSEGMTRKKIIKE